jgi:hypothetical protein
MRYRTYLPKTAGLVTWPASGIVITGLYIGIFAEDLATQRWHWRLVRWRWTYPAK